MTDVVDRATRSRMMSGIGGRDTKPEISVRKFLHARGFRYRIAPNNLPGRPDVVLPKYRTAIFVHGCFWHRHPGCKYATTPASRKQFWQAKFRENVARDERVVRELETLNWRVLIVWECSICTTTLNKLVAEITKGKQNGAPQ